MSEAAVSESHTKWMARAILEARRGWYSTHPNPRVGCVIVRHDEMIARGFHEYPGGPHAEINALAEIAGDARGSTVYVTLEPCSHSGKTPPCADALIKAAPDRVVVAMTDPNPLVAGSGIRKLREAGIEVISDVLKSQAEALNPGFIKRMVSKRPLLRLKMAMSLDGRTALGNGLSQWITAEDARHDVQFLRAGSSAVLSSAATVLADDAALTVRLEQEALKQKVPVRQPVRVIIDSQSRLTGREKLFAGGGEIWIFTAREADRQQRNFDACKAKTRVFSMPESAHGGINLAKLMDRLAELEINEIHSECGARLAGALLKQQLVDEMVVYTAPCLLGSESVGLVDLGEISIMSDRLPLAIRDVRMVGQDMRIRASVEY